MKPLTGNFKTRGIWWVRLFGFGVRVKRIALHPLLFSERQLGHGLTVLGWHVRFLRPGGC